MHHIIVRLPYCVALVTNVPSDGSENLRMEIIASKIIQTSGS